MTGDTIRVALSSVDVLMTARTSDRRVLSRMNIAAMTLTALGVTGIRRDRFQLRSMTGLARTQRRGRCERVHGMTRCARGAGTMNSRVVRRLRVAVRARLRGWPGGRLRVRIMTTRTTIGRRDYAGEGC
jgi:hypothetical protein